MDDDTDDTDGSNTRPEAREPAHLELGGTRKRWPVVLAVLVAVAVGVGGGVAVTRWRGLRDAEQDIGRAHTAQEKAEADADQARRERDDAIATAKTEAEAELAEQTAAVEAQAAEVSRQQDALLQAAATTASNRMLAAGGVFQDGLFHVGVDIPSGTYHTDAPEGCYWAKLSTSSPSEVIDNRYGGGPQTVTVDSAYFESRGCGQWSPAPAAPATTLPPVTATPPTTATPASGR
jgi:hypothetical protein